MAHARRRAATIMGDRFCCFSGDGRTGSGTIRHATVSSRRSVLGNYPRIGKGLEEAPPGRSRHFCVDAEAAVKPRFGALQRRMHDVLPASERGDRMPPHPGEAAREGGSRGDRPVAISARPISSPVFRHPNPAPVSLGPVTGNPVGARVRAGDINSGHPHPAVSAPAPVPWLPNHRGARRGWDGLLLGIWRTTWSAISLTGISRRLRGPGITRRLVRIGIGGRWILLCNRQGHRRH